MSKKNNRVYEFLMRIYQRLIHLLPKVGVKNESSPDLWTIPLGELDEDEELLTIDATCGIVNIVRSTLWRLRKEHVIRHVEQAGGGVRFRASDVEMLRKWYNGKR